MIAKNVGIRRASGEFILATNIDVIINQKLYVYFEKIKQFSVIDIVLIITIRNIEDNHLNNSQISLIENIILRCKNKVKYYVYSSVFRQIKTFLQSILKRKKNINRKNYDKKFIKHLKKIIFYLKNYKIFQKKLFTNACGDFTLLDKDSG